MFCFYNISGISFDTTITHIADTSFKFISQKSMEFHISYDWTVTVTDGISEGDLSVYNLLGQKVATLVNEIQSAGTYSVNWNAAGLPSGIYIYSIQTDYWQDTKKMVLLK